jgi:hypothetical protein
VAGDGNHAAKTCTQHVLSLGIINCKIERSVGVFASFCPTNSKTTLSKRLKAEGLTRESGDAGGNYSPSMSLAQAPASSLRPPKVLREL